MKKSGKRLLPHSTYILQHKNDIVKNNKYGETVVFCFIKPKKRKIILLFRFFAALLIITLSLPEAYIEAVNIRKRGTDYVFYCFTLGYSRRKSKKNPQWL
ncbi:hypothetical protein EUBSIR_02551 [[Eubacterium] siraeum DSM 15702]|uniref:Uncharacterized protein n=1 Tax=[Eubacterium] siraeum DSM 15702 TaxID=428128 RepID=B0MRR9_9FIRM|nr:hypothetical protein EUBSIR_02551 [[Eubacterium] siraeum DSM 15702]